MALSTAAADGPTSDRPKTMSGKFTNILIAFTVTTLPMVLLPAILLHLVFAYRLTQNVTASLDLQTSTDVEQSTSTAYYVNFSSNNFRLHRVIDEHPCLDTCSLSHGLIFLPDCVKDSEEFRE